MKFVQLTLKEIIKIVATRCQVFKARPNMHKTRFRLGFRPRPRGELTIRYDTTEEFNVDSKAEYTALSSTRSHKLKQTKQCPYNSVQVKICEVSPEGIRVTMEERICERDELSLE